MELSNTFSRVFGVPMSSSLLYDAGTTRGIAKLLSNSTSSKDLVAGVGGKTFPTANAANDGPSCSAMALTCNLAEDGESRKRRG